MGFFKTPQERRHGERAKSAFRAHGRCRLLTRDQEGATSPDGIHWRPLKENPIMPWYSDTMAAAFSDARRRGSRAKGVTTRCKADLGEPRRPMMGRNSLGRTEEALLAEEHKPSDDEEGDAQEDQARLLE